MSRTSLSKELSREAMPVTPVRASITDDPREILQFAAQEARSGGAALATLVEIRGGSARSLGAHVAVAADGRFCGYVSGGCIEAAIAAEALEALSAGEDRSVLFGSGSPFFDIVLPCGGGVTISIHIVVAPERLEEVIDRLDDRGACGLGYSPKTQMLSFIEDAPAEAGWVADQFLTSYRPKTRVLISGQAAEAEAVARLSQASGFDVVAAEPAKNRVDLLPLIDAFTAVALLQHDLEGEQELLAAALESPAFYVGALGSKRTHGMRIGKLRSAGFSEQAIDRIKAPIGLFGPTRNATSLALSVLAEIADEASRWHSGPR